MTITLDDVNKAAALASIKITGQEAKHYLENLKEILKLSSQMAAVDTDTIPAVARCFDLPQRLRVDKVTEINARKRLQQLTKQVQSGFYSVPPVIE